METIKAYTRQRAEVLMELEKNGVYQVKEAHIREKNDSISEYYLDLYRWYTREAAKRVPLPARAEFPIWLFLRKEEKLPLIPGTVVLELEIPKDKVVITEVERWGYRVNYMYIPLDAADEKNHEAELKRYGIGNETALIQTAKGNFYPLLKRKIIASWQRLFAPPRDSALVVSQGTVWELRKEWLINVEK